MEAKIIIRLIVVFGHIYIIDVKTKQNYGQYTKQTHKAYDQQ